MKKILIRIFILSTLVALVLLFVACGEEDPAEHVHSWVDATCTEPRHCTGCELTYGEALGHTEVTDENIVPTCTEPGKTMGKHCSVCGEVTLAQTVVDATGHSWSEISCEAPKTCSTCGETEGDALGHDMHYPDCYTPHTCTRCQITEGEAPGHDWQTDEATGIVLCVRGECEEIKDSEIPQDKNLILGLSKIPIATPDMTTDELRDIVIQFMDLQINFAFRVDLKDYGNVYGYYIKNLYGSYGGSQNLANLIIKYETGKYYGGIPYMGNAAGSLYRWLPFYDAQTGVMDWSPIIASRREQWYDSGKKITYPDVGSALFGNSCSSACFWAWSRVTNEINSFWTAGWVPSNGFIKVGDYDLAENDKHGSDTKALCKTNGEQRMFKAYAQTLRADGLVQTGHAVMIVADPVVVYNDDGTINGDESYVLIAEQKASFLTASPLMGGVDLYSPMNKKGVTYRIMGNYAGNTVNETLREMKWSFKTLYDKGFLPFTVPELAGTGKVEKSYVEFEYNQETISLGVMKNLELCSNYVISDVTINVKDASGNLVFTACYGNITNTPLEMRIRLFDDILTSNRMYENKSHIKDNLQKYTDGTYTIEILCRLGTGELTSVYKGIITD